MSCAEPPHKRKKEENMGEMSIEYKKKQCQMSEESLPDMFSEQTPHDSANSQPSKQISNLSFEGSFNDSPDMFSDFSSELEDSSTMEDDSGVGEGCAWRGVSLAELRGNTLHSQLPPVRSSRSHSVLCQVGSESLPPSSEAWDGDHVRMPCSSQSLYPVASSGGKSSLKSRWELVKQALNKKIISIAQLETAILSYNSQYASRWDFQGLHYFFSDILEPAEVRCFFDKLLPGIVQLALQLPVLVKHPLPLLRQHCQHSITLSQLQIASLLANALLCTFPRRNAYKQGSEYASFPDINFNKLFALHKKSAQRGSEKLKCIFHYFRRVCNKAPEGVVTFARHYIPPNLLPQWDHSTRRFTKLYISSSGTIEDEGFGMLQMDFANRKIGGGVLGWGCVQEEIRFVICPELIISRLFTESLDSTESLLITGCERFSDYKGYADNFEWLGDHSDKTPRDSSDRLMCSIVAIDALALRFPSIQFQPQNLRRELNKAYAGFHNADIPAEHLAPVATGNWGCGAYRGNPRLKALLQLMAAAQTGRHLAYFTFGDKVLRDDIFDMYTFLQNRKATVGQVWSVISLYSEQCYRNGKWIQDLYSFVKQMFDIGSVSTAGFDNQKEDDDTQNASGNEHASSFKTSTYYSVTRKETQSSDDTHLNTGRESASSHKEGDSKKSGMGDAIAESSSQRQSLVDSLEFYDTSSSYVPPKRKISDYFNVINVPK